MMLKGHCVTYFTFHYYVKSHVYSNIHAIFSKCSINMYAIIVHKSFFGKLSIMKKNGSCMVNIEWLTISTFKNAQLTHCPRDVILHHGPLATLVQVMACARRHQIIISTNVGLS